MTSKHKYSKTKDIKHWKKLNVSVAMQNFTTARIDTNSFKKMTNKKEKIKYI